MTWNVIWDCDIDSVNPYDISILTKDGSSNERKSGLALDPLKKLLHYFSSLYTQLTAAGVALVTTGFEQATPIVRCKTSLIIIITIDCPVKV